MKELSNQLEQLLLTQSFTDLSASDRAYVLSHMSAEEYEQYHTFLGCSTHTIQQFSGQADHSMKADLLAKVRQNKRAATPVWTYLIALFSYRVPAWQFAMSMALLMGTFWWVYQKKEVNLVSSSPVEYVYQTDTIYKEIVKTVSSTVLADTSDRTISITPIPVHSNTQPARNYRTQPLENDRAITISDTSSNPILAGKKSFPTEADRSNMFHLNASPRGRSVGEDTALMKFVVEVY